MVFPDNIEGVPPDVQVLIQEFSNTYHDATEALDKRQYETAREHYIDLLRIYQSLGNKEVDPIHTNIAYSCIEDLYQDLQHRIEVPVISTQGLRIGITASILVILMGLFIITNPSFVGLATLDLPQGIWQGPDYLRITGSTTVNLGEYVDTPGLTYLTTHGEGVQAHINGKALTLIPTAGYTGRSSITILGYAMDEQPELVLEQQLPVIVEERE